MMNVLRILQFPGKVMKWELDVPKHKFELTEHPFDMTMSQFDLTERIFNLTTHLTTHQICFNLICQHKLDVKFDLNSVVGMVEYHMMKAIWPILHLMVRSIRILLSNGIKDSSFDFHSFFHVLFQLTFTCAL